MDQLSPRMRRVVLAGDQLGGFTSLGADDHVKLFFPAPGQPQPILPIMQDGAPTYPEAAEPPAARDFTPRRYNPETNELTLDFVIHGDGPASAWAAQADFRLHQVRTCSRLRPIAVTLAATAGKT